MRLSQNNGRVKISDFIAEMSCGSYCRLWFLIDFEALSYGMPLRFVEQLYTKVPPRYL